MTTKDFIRFLLKKVEESSNPFVGIEVKSQSDVELICAANNLSLAIWQPATRQVYVRVEDCNRYLNT